MAKFQGNILSLSENIAKSFRRLLFWLALYGHRWRLTLTFDPVTSMLSVTCGSADD